MQQLLNKATQFKNQNPQKSPLELFVEFTELMDFENINEYDKKYLVRKLMIKFEIKTIDEIELLYQHPNSLFFGDFVKDHEIWDEIRKSAAQSLEAKK